MTDDEMLEAYNTAVDAAMDRACERDGFASNMSRGSRGYGLSSVPPQHGHWQRFDPQSALTKSTACGRSTRR